MKVIDILTNEIKETTELIALKKLSKDYILSIPHSGKLIPLKFKDKYNLGKSILLGSDLHTEEVYNSNRGISIISNLNSYCPNMSRLREGSKNPNLPIHLQQDPLNGLSLTNEPILKEEYNSEEREEILKFYDIYHNHIRTAIEEMKKEKNFALIFDCHSMFSIGLKNTPDEGKERPDITLGTLDDTSADKKIIDTFYKTLKSFNLDVTKNDIYKGGYITQKYSKPKENIHVIQIELKKSLYMNGNFKIEEEKLKKINSILTNAFKITSKETNAMTGI